jgi:hypothetical protein
MSTGIGTRLSELILAGKMTEYAALKRVALAQGTDPALIESAEKNYWTAQAMYELSKILKNPDNVSGNIEYGTPEFIHIDETLKALQRMQDDTSCTREGCSTFVHAAHGTSRLEQALGKKGTDDLLRKMYAAQRQEKRIIKNQRIAKWAIAGIVVFVVVLIYWIFF